MNINIHISGKFEIIHRNEPVDTIGSIDFIDKPGGIMSAERSINVGEQRVLTPSASKGGAAVPFPANTVYDWEASDSSLISFDDATRATPLMKGLAASPTDTPVTITLTVNEDGFIHQVVHTYDVMGAVAVDTIDAIDFSDAPITGGARGTARPVSAGVFGKK